MAASRPRVLVTAVAVAVTVVAGMGLGVWPASSATEDQIEAVHSGKVMDVAGSTIAGAPVFQSTADGGADQAWNVVELTRINGWPLVLIQSAKSGLVLDVVGGFTGRGAGLVQNTWAASASQLWLLVPYGNTGLDLLMNIKSGRVADVAGASPDDGASIIQWDWQGTANQIWDMPTPEPLPTTTTTSATSTSTSTTTAPTTTTTAPTTTTTAPMTTTTTAGPLPIITIPTIP